MTPHEAVQIAAEFTHQNRKLFGERIAFIRDEAQIMSTGGLHIPGGIVKQSGTIVMVGVDVDTAKHDVKIGDRILFTRYEPAAVGLSRKDGSEAVIYIVHVADLYVGWDDPELRKEYMDACEALRIDT